MRNSIQSWMVCFALAACGTSADAHSIDRAFFEEVARTPDLAGEEPVDRLMRAAGMGPFDHPLVQAAMEVAEAYRSEVLDPIDTSRRRSSFHTDGLGEIRVGAGSRAVTPARGCPLAGYGDRIKTIPFLWNPILDPLYYAKLLKASHGVHDEVYAKALVIESDGERACLVGVDAVGVTQLIFEDVLRAVEPYGIEREGLIIGGSHSHGGPGDAADRFLWWFAADLFDLRIYRALVDEVAGAIIDAVADLEPGRIGVGSTNEDFGLSRNRREGQTIVDPELAVLRADDAGGNPKAIVFNFAVHGTMLGGDNMRFTADCMGRARAELETTLGATALFLNGTEGDVSPSSVGGADDWERSQLWGEAMAEHVLSLRDEITTWDRAELSGAHVFVDLPAPYMRPGFFLEPPAPGNMTVPLFGLVERNDTNFSGIRVGPALFVSMPGEATTAIGLEIKEYGDSRGHPRSFVVGLANGHLGYMVSQDEYWAGGYESGATLYGPETGPLMVESAEAVIDLLTPSRRRLR